MIKGVEYKPLQVCNFNMHDATLAWIELAMCHTLQLDECPRLIVTCMFIV
jgi:hypothetical protein